MSELPELKALVERLKDKPFALIGINTDGERETVKPRLDKEGVTWRNAIEGRRPDNLPKAWKVQMYPTTYILDSSGKIRFKNKRGEAIGAAVDKLLAEK